MDLTEEIVKKKYQTAKYRRRSKGDIIWQSFQGQKSERL
jgi:hypothetical protein